MILITGATGNNGRELVRQLVAAGQRVRALVRNPAKAAELKGPNVELAVGDFDQPATLDAALRGMDKSFLLTPVAEHFVEWQSAFIEAAQRAELKHLVKFSGMGADSGAKVELLRFHGETDNLLRNSGVPFTILQPNSFHQNILSSVDTIWTQGAFYWPLENAAQSTVDIRDICCCRESFYQSWPRGKSLRHHRAGSFDISASAEKLSAVLGREIQYVDVPLSAAEDGMRKSGMPEWNIRAVGELLGYFASGAAATVTDTVPHLIGRPAIPFEQFVQDHRAAFLP
jgi:uncharacterized protein YbjT (DUF2867 family)